jgi:hypothetical protein
LILELARDDEQVMVDDVELVEQTEMAPRDVELEMIRTTKSTPASGTKALSVPIG